jgi:hypothetical protein
MEVSGQLHAAAAWPPGKEHLVPIGLGGPQSGSGRGGGEKISQPLPEINCIIIIIIIIITIIIVIKPSRISGRDM